MESWIFKGYYPFALNRQEEFYHLSDAAASPFPDFLYSRTALIAEATLVAHAILALPIVPNASFDFYD
jgi:hypothetical protein